MKPSEIARLLSNEAMEAAADAYEEGVQPGDEFYGDRVEISYMAEKVVRAALKIALSPHQAEEGRRG